MNGDLKQKWISALRSGEYKQARLCLFNGEGYCCLGVLCKIAGREVPMHSMDPADDVKEKNEYFWIDSIIGEGHRCNLVIKNDEMQRTFAEIADYIEAIL